MAADPRRGAGGAEGSFDARGAARLSGVLGSLRPRLPDRVDTPAGLRLRHHDRGDRHRARRLLRAGLALATGWRRAGSSACSDRCACTRRWRHSSAPSPCSPCRCCGGCPRATPSSACRRAPSASARCASPPRRCCCCRPPSRWERRCRWSRAASWCATRVSAARARSSTAPTPSAPCSEPTPAASG